MKNPHRPWLILAAAGLLIILILGWRHTSPPAVHHYWLENDDIYPPVQLIEINTRRQRGKTYDIYRGHLSESPLEYNPGHPQE